MINETLEQLKIKPIPKKPQQFQVMIQIPSEGVGPTIIDKTSEQLINREQFFSDLQENLGVVQKDYIKTKKLSTTIKDNQTMEITEKMESKKLEHKPKIYDPENTLTQIVKTRQQIIIKEASNEALKQSKTINKKDFSGLLELQSIAGKNFKKGISIKPPEILCDITKEIPCKDNSVILIFSRETLEHLKYRELINHLICVPKVHDV